MVKPEREVIAAVIRHMDRTPYVVTTLVLDMQGNVIGREERWENVRDRQPKSKLPSQPKKRGRRTKAEANAIAARVMDLHRSGMSTNDIADAVDANPAWVLRCIKEWDQRKERDAAIRARNAEIVALHRRGWTLAAIAAQFGFSATYIRDLVTAAISVDE